jgi:hypothetical protein
MFAYAALLLAGFSATNVATVQPSDLAFGREQVEQFIHGRPDAGVILNSNPALKEQLALLFADDGEGSRVCWDSREPSNCAGAPAEHRYSRGDHPASVQVSNRSVYSPIDKCEMLIFELHNIQSDRNFKALELMASRKQISREDFVRSTARVEFEAAKRERVFLLKYPLGDVNAIGNPYYASAMKVSGDFADYFRQLESYSAGADYLDYYRKLYDHILSPKPDPKLDLAKIETRSDYGAMPAAGDLTSIFARFMETDSSEKAYDNASDLTSTHITRPYVWGDARDWTFAVSYFALIALVLVAGYGSMGLHIRDYLRSLRRALVLIGQYSWELPEWIRRDRPRCVQALGLHLPCTAAEVLAAYRKKVKLVHPDRGGDPREFLRLQDYFEQAMALVCD